MSWENGLFIISTFLAVALAINNICLRKQNCSLKEDKLMNILRKETAMHLLNQMWKTAKRRKTSLAIIMVDIDQFKLYNDNYGHVKGDVCLSKVAEALKSQLRKADVIGRYGGEEIIIALPDTNEKDAMMIAKRLRLAVSNQRILHKGSQVSRYVTVSVGVCSAVPGEYALNIQKMIEYADEALYKVKSNGRNGEGFKAPGRVNDDAKVVTNIQVKLA